MASKTDICNFALTLINARRITAVTDDNERARLCDLFYDQSRKEALEAHTWGSATKRASIASDATDPAWGYDHRYLLPNDYVRMITIESGSGLTWELEDGYIVTSQDTPLKIKYVYDLEDTTQMSPTLVRAIAERLALWLATKITTSNTKKAEVKASHEQTLRDAKRFDGRQRSPVPLAATSWISARG